MKITNRRGFKRLTRNNMRVASVIVLSLFSLGFLLQPYSTVGAEPWPTASPASICGNSSILDGGPASAPAGAITVPAGDNADFNFNQTGVTFWFESGTHHLGNDLYGQIITKAGNTYIGAPGAVIDGQHLNLYAFTGDVANVTIKYLTIINFGRGNDNNNEGVVNHDSGTHWIIERNTISNNDGAGVFLGSDNEVRYNCLKDNGQYGFSMFKSPIEGDSAIKNITLDHNEISGNNQDDWEAQIEGCGCTGGGKFWDVNGATVTNNYVHDNLGTGLWADTNNIDFLFEGNYIDHNNGEGIWYEISYNATIRNNTISRNAWISGQRNTGSPGAAIYLSESGGDSRLATTKSGAAQIRVYDNNFVDNFSGVSVYENANRFCNSNGNTSKGYCTPFVTPTLLPDEDHNYDYPNPIVTNHPCYTNIASSPYTNDCRWHSKNIEVSTNEFHFDDTVVPCAGTYCGAQALYATGADNMSWSPYTVSGVQNDVMFNNSNSFHDNHYYGNWKFAKGYGETINFAAWQSSPYNQDANSTIEGQTETGGSGGGSTILNDIDTDTSTLEGSIGQWDAWYSAAVSQSNAEAHTGTHSLKVDVTDPWGWGVQLANWPGFTTSPGLKTISLWGKLGSGTNLHPKMQVKWLSSSNTLLQTDEVELPNLTSSWQKASALVEAPAGSSTALVYLLGSGSAGNSVYLDDMSISEPINTIDAATSDLETGIGAWESWYSADVAQSDDTAQKGTKSLKISVTDPWGWAVQLSNWPGFDTSAGGKRISYWAKKGTGSINDVALRVKWLDSNGGTLQSDTVPVTTTTSWQHLTTDVTAPSGAVNATIEISSDDGTTGDTLYIDNVGIYNK